MAHKYLGPVFDIHGGGRDLIFPHHENEIAQSTAAGDEFAHYWMHNAWVTISGEKMAKSLGNSVLALEMIAAWRPLVLRYYLGSAHYRSTIEYSPDALREAEEGFARIEGFIARAVESAGPVEAAAEVPAEFAAAMDEDLGVPQALAVLHTTVTAGNTALGAGEKDIAAARLAEVRAMLGVLGMDPLAEPWAAAGAAGAEEELRGVVDGLVGLVLEQRQAARERKDFATADAIRDSLAAAGLVIEDTPAGPRWSLR
jgi:cysteinyl-tRNA synthetase